MGNILGFFINVNLKNRIKYLFFIFIINIVVSLVYVNNYIVLIFSSVKYI